MKTFSTTAPVRRMACLALLALCAALGASFLSPGGDAARPARYGRILVVNDDGIDSGGLAALVRELAKDAEVWVSAPEGNRSGASLSSDGWGKPMSLAEHTIAGAERACAVGGKPVDATHFGLFGMLPDGKAFDLVVSGINHGANVGTLSHYSGTVGAAMAAAHLGLPAVAVSQHHELPDYDFAARFAARFVALLREKGARTGVVYSINVPKGTADAIEGVVPARMGGDPFAVSKYVEHEDADGEKTCRGVIAPGGAPPAGSDTAAFQAGAITVTPLSFDWTDEAALAELAGWGLTVE
jgi:5'-nucleotidase